MHVDKIEIDQLFSGMKLKTIDPFAEDFNENKNKEIKPEVNDLFKPVLNSEISFSNQKWYLQNEFANFGPYSSEEVYVFLAHLFEKNPEMKDDHSFMVIDSMSDIYYKPDAVVELLASRTASARKDEQECVYEPASILILSLTVQGAAGTGSSAH